MHTLSLSYNNSPCNSLSIQDNSIYDINIPLQNIILEIKPPTKTCFYIFNLQPGWCSKTFTCTDFDLCCGSDETSLLPDGIYEIKYSVDPNLSTMIEFNHFKVCNLFSAYLSSLCVYFSQRTNYNKTEKENIESNFSEVKRLINFAIYSAEECLDTIQAIFFYNEASSKLKQINNDCPTCK